MNQRERVLMMLKSGPVCGTDFLKVYVPRYAARVLELRQQGYQISTRRCENGWHGHESPQVVYELETADQKPLALEWGNEKWL